MQKRNIVVIADVGHIGSSYQPGHGHADALSFELSIGNKRLIVNSGTSCYADTQERSRQRGTSSHNTLVINNQNSSDTWKSFRVGRRATVQNIETEHSDKSIYLAAQHNGYYHSYKITHARKWMITNNRLIITDTLLGSGIHLAKLSFHFHPDIKLIKRDNVYFIHDKNNNHLASLTINVNSCILPSTYHPEFNLSIASQKIVAVIKQGLPAYFKTSIRFH